MLRKDREIAVNTLQHDDCVSVCKQATVDIDRDSCMHTCPPAMGSYSAACLNDAFTAWTCQWQLFLLRKDRKIHLCVATGTPACILTGAVKLI